MSDPTAGLLEGLLGGFQGGYNLRETRKGNKRRERLQDELATLRQLESRRAETRAAHEDVVFQEGQDEYQRAQALRKEVGTYLAAPTRFKTLGRYISGQPGERQAPPLSNEAVRAREVGRTLGQFGGADVSDEQALLLGSGAVPASAIAPKRYQPRTRQEFLENLRYAASLHPGAYGRLPITENQGYQVVDNIYGIWRGGERVGHHLTPAQRNALVKKMVAGTVQPSDFPDIPGESRGNEPTAAPTAAPHRGAGLLDWVKGLFGGGQPAANPTAPAAPDTTTPDQGDEDRIGRARALLQEYRDLPPEDLEQALRDEGYTEEEIADIIGSPTE